jgi:Asp-tRNA(Asn)/Glu-tRNA(Gln) amidotransferase B subunit
LSFISGESVPLPEFQTYSSSAGIVQLQLEQDSGKSLHDAAEEKSLIDLNR